MQQGQGPGLSQRFLGETGGEQTVTLLQTEMPVHSHTMQTTATAATVAAATNNQWAMAQAGGAKGGGGSIINMYSTTTNSGLAQMSPFATSIAGGSLPHNNMPPFLGLTFIIAMQGVFPPRT
jgi:microcystin-dependent protein